MDIEKVLIGADDFNEKMDNLIIAIHGIGAGQGGNITINSWKQIQQIVRAGLAPKYFSIGDQLIVNKESSINIACSNNAVTATINATTFINKIGEAGTKDYEATYDGAEWHDENGNNLVLSEYGITLSGTPAANDKLVIHEIATKIAFDIIGFDVDVPANPDFTHSMTLQAHNVFQSFQFDASELMLYCPDGLAAGTYHFKLDRGMYGGNTGSDGNYQFTLTQAIPAGGGLRHSSIGSYQGGGYTKAVVTSGTFTTYKADCSVNESNIACTEGTDGTDLGTFSAREQYCTTEEKLTHNCTEKQYYGNNNYLKSALRRWLNSDASAGNWWAKTHVFDMPNSAKSSAGFLFGLDPAFVDVVGIASKTVKEDEVWDKGGEKAIPDKFFLLSNKEIRFTSLADEGDNYPYWTRLIPTATNDANDNRIKTLNGSATHWWTRTCERSYGFYQYGARPNGAYYDDGGANYTLEVVPACVII